MSKMKNWTFPEYSKNWKILSEHCKQRDDRRCTKCGRPSSPNNKLHAHHIVSKSKGGMDRVVNLRTLCEECHALMHSHMKRKKK
jgi:5-methylcytosine-specific restriction endonuclease McrA